MITLRQLQDCTGATEANALTYLEALNSAMQWGEINTHQRIAAFLATISVESARLTAVEEGLHYRSAERLCKIFPRVFPTLEFAEPCVANPTALSQKLYGGFHGRGLIQLTWERNYRACGDALGIDLVSNPELLLKPTGAAMSAAWFWKANRCNVPADLGDMDRVTRIVNGPAKLHLAERVRQYHLAVAALTTSHRES
jgi:putative chitinase